MNAQHRLAHASQLNRSILGESQLEWLSEKIERISDLADCGSTASSSALCSTKLHVDDERGKRVERGT